MNPLPGLPRPVLCPSIHGLPFLLVILVPFLFGADPSTAAGTTGFQLIVETGDPVPGAGAGETFAWLSGPSAFFKGGPHVTSEGDVSYSGGWTSPSSSNGLFRIVGAVAEPVVLLGDLAPGTSSNFVGFPAPFTLPAELNSGVSVFNGSGNFLGTEDGVWGDRFGSIERIILPGDHPLGTVATAGFSQWTQRFVGSGIFVINAKYTVPGNASLNYHGFWRDASGTLDPVALGGNQAPDTITGVLYGNGSRAAFDSWDADSQGQLAFKATLMGAGVGVNNDEGIWVETSGGLGLLVRESDAIASIPGATFTSVTGFKTFDSASVLDVFLNDAGHVAFGTNFDLPGAGYSNGVFTTRAGVLELVVHGRAGGSIPAGDLAPGFTNGETFVSFGAGIMGSAGNLAFNAFLDDGNPPTGIWATYVEDGGVLTYVMKAGDPAQDLASTTFRSDRVPVFRHLTGDGELFFTAETTGPTGNGLGLFARKSGGPLRCVVATTQQVEVASGDVREVDLLVMGAGFSDDREMVVHLGFTDGSEGIFLVDDGTTTSVPIARLDALERFGPSRPNPFNPQTVIPFALHRPAHVRLTIFDVAGRKIAAVLDEELPAGDHRPSWDGHDDAGRALASGSYFASIEVEGSRQTRKLTLLK